MLHKKALFWGIDHIELYLKTFDKFYDDHEVWHDFKGLDDDNSSQYYIFLFWKTCSVTKTFPKGFAYAFQFSVSIDDRPVQLFMIRFPNKNEHRPSIVIYSSFFILEKYLEVSISYFLQQNFFVDTIRRLDIALDVSIQIETLLKKYFKNTRFTSQIGLDRKSIGFHQTYYIWEIQSDKNRKYIIRIYDKLLDTWKKNKGFLYSHLKNSPDVRRIELELRPHECERLPFTYQEILENKNNAIQRIFSDFLNKHWSIHLPSGISLIPYHYDPYDLKAAYDQTGFIPKRYLASARWYFRKIIENTGFRWLAQTLASVEFSEPPIRVQKMDIHKTLQFLEAYIDFCHELWIQRSLIKKVVSRKL